MLSYSIWITFCGMLAPSRTKDIITPNIPLQNYTTCRVSCLKEHGNSFLSQYLRLMPHNVNPCFTHFLMLRSARDIKIWNFLSRNCQKNWLICHYSAPGSLFQKVSCWGPLTVKWLPSPDFRQNFGRQKFFPLTMGTKMVTAWSAVLSHISCRPVACLAVTYLCTSQFQNRPSPPPPGIHWVVWIFFFAPR